MRQITMTVTPSTYWYVLFPSMAVHATTWQYMAVNAKFYRGTWRYMAVHGSVYHGLWQYMAVHGGTWAGFAPRGGVPLADFAALLKALLCLQYQWQQLLQGMACTNSFIRPLLPLPAPPLTRFDLAADSPPPARLRQQQPPRQPPPARRWVLRRLPKGNPGPTCGRRNLGRRGGRGGRRDFNMWRRTGRSSV